jgi:hypothetical protein
MNDAKKRRLEAAGWKETTVQEFLNLSEADAQYIETKLALSRRLRSEGFSPYWRQRAPPNDGGIAVGQMDEPEAQARPAHVGERAPDGQATPVRGD